jgi:glycerol uptake facilitator-like aquaporin
MMFHFIGSISPTPWANGISLMVLVYFVAKISGAHLNPTVSTVFMILGHINPYELLAYWIAQVCGCAVGALWIWALVPQLYLWKDIEDVNALAHSGCFVPKQGITDVQIFGWETLCTFCFIAPVFAVVWYTSHKSGYGNTGPIMVGLSLMANAFVAGQFTGAALNPARALGSPIVLKCPANDKLGYYILGEMTAGLLAPVILIPWYGIANNCWYINYFPNFVKKFIKLYQPSVKITTIESPKGTPSHSHDNSVEIVESRS